MTILGYSSGPGPKNFLKHKHFGVDKRLDLFTFSPLILHGDIF